MKGLRWVPVGRISPGPTRCPPGAEKRLVPEKSNLKPQNSVQSYDSSGSKGNELYEFMVHNGDP